MCACTHTSACVPGQFDGVIQGSGEQQAVILPVEGQSSDLFAVDGDILTGLHVDNAHLLYAKSWIRKQTIRTGQWQSGTNKKHLQMVTMWGITALNQITGGNSRNPDSRTSTDTWGCADTFKIWHRTCFSNYLIISVQYDLTQKFVYDTNSLQKPCRLKVQQHLNLLLVFLLLSQMQLLTPSSRASASHPIFKIPSLIYFI